MAAEIEAGLLKLRLAGIGKFVFSAVAVIGISRYVQFGFAELKDIIEDESSTAVVMKLALHKEGAERVVDILTRLEDF